MTTQEISLIGQHVVPVDAVPRRRLPWTRALFASTAFMGAGLLFIVQPLVAKLLLPAYGGSPTVWSTSSLFFQSLLLAGYVYVHWSTGRLGARRHLWLHAVVLGLPLLALPLALPLDNTPPVDVFPALWLLRTLALVVGLPFVVVATTGPLLQKWFSWTKDDRATDPYFLFAASNLGSFGGLLAYPFLIEPTLSLDDQRVWWSAGCAVWVGLTCLCGVAARPSRRAEPVAVHHVVESAPREAIPRGRVLLWLGLSFLPSSLMLAVTAHLSTDVAAIPMLWVVPLAIYLATFVVAFSRRSRAAPVRPARLAAGLALTAAVSGGLAHVVRVEIAIIVNLTLLAMAGYAAHARLAADRPSPERLTFFYVVVAVGGAIGGLLNGLVAPVVFDRVWEYPLALLAVPLLLVGAGGIADATGLRHAALLRRVLLPAVLGGALLLVGAAVLLPTESTSVLAPMGLVALSLFLGWRVARRPVLLCIALAVLFVGVDLGPGRQTLDQSRTFFGTYRVDGGGGQHTLVHGTTTHGTQWTDDARRRQPTTYYSQAGPVGDVFDRLGARFDRIGAVGLGTGTLAAYGRESQRMTFFEIDPEVVRIASDPALFTYLEDSPATIRTVVGDGRLELADVREGSLDLLVLDAFSSDSIPVHLLTLDAMRMYAERLSPDGVMAVHISNRVFDLEPVLAAAAHDLGWRAARRDSAVTDDLSVPSEWVVLSPDDSAVRALVEDRGWRALRADRTVRWTDDYSSLLAVLR